MISPTCRVDIIYYRLYYFMNGMVLPYAGDSGAIIFTMYDIKTLRNAYIFQDQSSLLMIIIYCLILPSKVNRQNLCCHIQWNYIKNFITTTMLSKLLLTSILFSLVLLTYQNKRLAVNEDLELSNEEQYKLFKQMYVISRLMSQNKQNEREQIKNISSSEEISFKNKLDQCQLREKMLEEQNQKLRHELQNMKQNYHKLQSSFDNQTNWPLLVFLTFALFIVYLIYGIEAKVPKNTTLNKFTLTKDIGQCQFTQHTVIKKTSGDWIKLLMDDSILRKKQCMFKIKKRDSWPINLGIIKMNDKKNKENSEERIIYGSDCTFYQNSLLKMREGIGFEAGEIVKIVVQPQQNKIRWEIEDLVIHSYQSQSLNLKDGKWRFAIEMRGNADEVQLIQ